MTEHASVRIERHIKDLFLHKQVEVIVDTLVVCGTLLFVEASDHGQLGNVLLADGDKRLLVRGSFVKMIRRR